MKIKLKLQLAIMVFSIGAALQVCAQGSIVPNGVVYVGGSLNEIDVSQNFAGSDYTGFALIPQGANSFLFSPIADQGVRVFLILANNQPVSLSPILANSYPELTNPNTYTFPNGFPFYVGLYTSDQYAVNGIYPNPLFGWAQLVNNNGTIQLLGGALEYGGDGIYAGTLNIIPEPGSLSLFALGGLLLGWRRWRAK